MFCMIFCRKILLLYLQLLNSLGKVRHVWEFMKFHQDCWVWFILFIVYLHRCVPVYSTYIFHGLLLGYCRYGSDLVKQLTASLHNVLASCGTIRISFSRRTPAKVLFTDCISNYNKWQHVYCVWCSEPCWLLVAFLYRGQRAWCGSKSIHLEWWRWFKTEFFWLVCVIIGLFEG